MEVTFSKAFKKAFRKRAGDSPFEELFWQKVEQFISDPFDAQLRTYKLPGKLKDLWSFTISNVTD